MLRRIVPRGDCMVAGQAAGFLAAEHRPDREQQRHVRSAPCRCPLTVAPAARLHAEAMFGRMVAACGRTVGFAVRPGPSAGAMAGRLAPMDAADAAHPRQVPADLHRAICRAGPDIGAGVARFDRPLAPRWAVASAALAGRYPSVRQERAGQGESRSKPRCQAGCRSCPLGREAGRQAPAAADFRGHAGGCCRAGWALSRMARSHDLPWRAP